MITREKLRDSVARIRLMKHFPGSDPEVQGALAVELSELCSDDAALKDLVSSLIVYESWPGIHELHAIASERKRRLDGEEKLRQARAARDLHEASCSGYTIRVDEQNRTVEVSSCNAEWAGYGRSYSESLLECRRGNGVDVTSILKAELVKRGEGWMSRRDFEKSRHFDPRTLTR